MKRSEFLRLSTAGVVACSLWPHRSWGSIDFSFQGTPTGIRPYLHAPRPDSMRISWWTDADNQSFIDYGTDASNLNSTVSGSRTVMGAGYHYHAGQLTGLTPNTYYHYRVRTENATSEVFRFRTPKPIGTSTGKFRVLVLGDNQIITPERRYERFVERAKKKVEDLYGVPIEESIDLVIMPGDQVDVGTLNHYRNLHFAYNGWISPYLPIMTTIGNHETYSDPGLANYRTLFTYDDLDCMGVSSPDPEVYYAYQLANIAFVHTSSEHTGNTQLGWIQNLVNTANSDSSVDWMISLCHRPYQAEQYIGDISVWLRNTAMQVLAGTEKHVLNIGAHHHIYTRGQTREWPIYHIISGGTAWDQAWGFSNEADYDDVQKTLAHWAWQLIEFDLDARTMDVQCFAEANVRFPEETRWTTRSYNSQLVDRFQRKLNLGPPDQPSLTNAPAAPVNLPLELTGSAFSSSSGESLNSTWFQVATDPAFQTLKVDQLRDVENVYGDTGAPDFIPIDTQAGIDIQRLQLAADSLPNGTYYARIRHRDTNTLWSDWSAPLTFEVTGSNATLDPAIEIAKQVFAPGEDIRVNYTGAPGIDTDWIGIYAKGDAPGSETSTQWAYLTGNQSAGPAPPTGFVDFTSSLPQGEWFVAFFTNDGYTEIAPRLEFYVGNPATLASNKENYDEGEDVVINFSNARGAPSDWIGIYKRGRTPGAGGGADDWAYLDGTTDPTGGGITSGEITFSGLPKGYYFADYFLSSGYFSIGERILFSIGSEIGEVSMGSNLVQPGDDFTVFFADGPGTPKDWVGLFRRGDDPNADPLTAYLYVDGNTEGSVTFELPDLPPGDYFLALFINDSYTEVSNRFAFGIPGNEDVDLEELGLDGSDFEISWMSRAGSDYRIMRSTDMEDWTTVRTVRGTGARMQEKIAAGAAAPDEAFFMVEPVTPASP